VREKGEKSGFSWRIDHDVPYHRVATEGRYIPSGALTTGGGGKRERRQQHRRSNSFVENGNSRDPANFLLEREGEKKRGNAPRQDSNYRPPFIRQRGVFWKHRRSSRPCHYEEGKRKEEEAKLGARTQVMGLNEIRRRSGLIQAKQGGGKGEK